MFFLSMFFVRIFYLLDWIGIYYVNMNLFITIVLVEFCNY